ncbi:MAG: TetR/AcrR family transcriptional regulator [Bacteroidales bacterium]
MKREQILESAYKDFATYGIKRVSMDEVVQNLKISKKTLYEFFSNKEELVYEAVKSKIEKEIKLLDSIDNAQPNILRALIFRGVESFKFFNSISPAFYNDVKFYPQVEDFFTEIKHNLELNGRKRIKKGIDNGYLSPQFNYDIVAQLFMSQVMNKQEEWLDKYTPSQICFISLITIFRGVCTDKGRSEIAEIEKTINI